MRYESGFAFLAALVPWLATAASEVIGGVAAAGAMVAIQAAMSPRSQEEQANAVNRFQLATDLHVSQTKWIAAAAAYERQLAQGVLSGEREWSARENLRRAYAFFTRTDVSDIEREAAFIAMRMRFAELLTQETPTTTGGGTKTSKPPTSPGTTSTVPTGAPVPMAASASGAPVGTILAIAGVALVGGGLWWASTKRGGRR